MARSILASLLAPLLASGFVVSVAAGGAGCLAHQGNAVAAVGYRAIRPSPRTRRVSVDRPLAIHLTAAVQDRSAQAPAPGMSLQVDQFRATVGNALLQSFQGNFTAVTLAPGEARAGLELVVLKATLEPTTTISYHAVLMLDGEEVVDLAGVTEGRAIATSMDGYQSTAEALLDEAVAKACEAIYEKIFYGEGADARLARLQAV